jgi:hypothetical protein
MGKTNNVESLVNRTTVQGSGATQSQGFVSHPFSDAAGAYPFANEEGKPVTTKGGQLINTYGADVPDDTIQGNNPGTVTCYTHTTPAGHTIEYNDTPGSERIMIRHMNGDGINIGPDGSIIISGKRRIDKAQEDYFLEVKNGTMKFEGNLTLDVTGDFNVNVGGEYNVNSAKKTEVVKKGPYTRTIAGDDIKTVDGNQTNLVTKGGAHQYLEGLSTIVKGDSRYIVEGHHTEAISGVLTMTSEEEVVLTSPEANIAADNLSVFGDTGTIGGENIIAYVKNIYGVSGDFSARFKAPVFEGDLDGNALTATTAGTSLHQSYPDGSAAPSTYTPSVGVNPNYTVDDTEIDDTATAKPTSTLLTDYRTKSAKGVKIVKVDPNDIQKNNIDLSKKTAGVTNRELTIAEIRRKMRDPAHRDNPEFTALMVSQEKLSPEFANSSPHNVETVEDTSSIIVQGQTVLGNPSPNLTSKRIIV